MSILARSEFNRARVQQTTQNDARSIFRGVRAAQQNPTRAAIRWPFELIQNAHDSGPRQGDELVEINFVLLEDRLLVSHTGQPFVAQELAALLSGGSSKEFDSKETTGRFGTGFLVTHAVSTQVDVNGVLATEEGPEVFHIKLARDGDEESIVSNIEQANDSLEEAETGEEAWIANNPTASFTYHNPSSDIVQRGLDRLEQTLPYLYATCSKLGQVRIERLGESKCFAPESSAKSDDGDFVTYKTTVSVRSTDSSRLVTAVRIGPKDEQAALLTLLEHCETDCLRVLIPSESFSRVFVTLPIAGTDFLPFNVVLDGDFAPGQERDGIAMDDAGKALLQGALSALPTFIQHAVESGWRDAHRLASLAAPTQTFSGEAESGELQWWESTILQVVREIASRSIVRSERGLLPALAEQGPIVSFLVPAIEAKAADYVDYDTFHSVAGAVTELNLPSKEVAESWGDITRQWHQSGVPVDRLGLRELTDRLKEKCRSVSDLPVEGNPFCWLGRLFLLAADMKDQNVRELVNGLLPNQHGVLTNTDENYLYSDGGISPEVKDVGSALGKDLRQQLLHYEMEQVLLASGQERAKDLAYDLLDEIDGGKYSESKATDLILDQLAKALPNDVRLDGDTNLTALVASARLVVHLAMKNDMQRLRACPLLTAAGQVARLSRNLQILAPVTHWPETARPYATLYALNRLLANRYYTDQRLFEALTKLIAVGLVIPAPLYYGRRAELDDVNLLREMSQDGQEVEDITVRNATFGQIAFLATELVQRCGQSVELAKTLLDFVLNVAAREDQNWREMDRFSGSLSGERTSLTLNKAMWPFELKVRSWIPIQAPDADAPVPMPANESNLREILDPSWLKHNQEAVDLLSKVFGFSRLTLMLGSLSDEIEGDLVTLLQRPELVKAAATYPEAVTFASELHDSNVALDSVRDFVQDAMDDKDLLEHLENRRNQRHRVHDNQNLGATVEKLVSEVLREEGFSVCRTGVGSDIEIALETGHLGDLHVTRKAQKWLVEIKATRDHRVRMTDTQAKTAVNQSERFLLCVVPVDSDNTCIDVDDVRSNMRFVADLGGRLADLCNDLGAFEDLRSGITSEASEGVQLEIWPGPARFRVASSVWENDGFPLDDLTACLLS